MEGKHALSARMNDFSTIYESFNYIEGFVWLMIAIAIVFLFPRTTSNQKLGLAIASVGFIAFGISDFLEVNFREEIPVWVLVYKIICGALMLSGRYTYLGWKKFSLRDRYFLFGLFCLFAVFGIIAMRSYAFE